jgi:hypothetical protein
MTVLDNHFAFRHDGDLNGLCKTCGEPLIPAHEWFVFDDDGPIDAMCTVGPVSMAESLGYIKKEEN